MAKILEDDIIDLRHDDFIDDEPKITRKVSIDTSSEKPKVSVTSNAPSKTQQKQGKPAEHIVIKIPKIPVKYVERGFYWIVIIILLFLLFKQPVTDFFSSSKIVLEEEIANAEENLENEPAAPSSNTTVPTPPKTETKTVPKTTTISTAKCSGGITLNLQDSGIRSEAIL
ncbi:hypothetical protein COV16_05830, partial [Candidatus Woesearchaeota archaeon CG10_big_fil_rev_8_21_14_0_10_34_8]